MTEHSSQLIEKDYEDVSKSVRQKEETAPSVTESEDNRSPSRNGRKDSVRRVRLNALEEFAPADEFETSGSEVSTIHNGSEISTVPDKYGFIGGQQYKSYDGKNSLDPAVILKREKKWLDMLKSWESCMKNDYKKVRNRCRKGIPTSVRANAWFHLCGGKFLLDQHPGYYQQLIEQEGDPKVMDEIRKDIERQFPLHEMFCDPDKPGQTELSNVLKAYSIVNPKVGFCQAQAPIAAFLLLHMPAEHAFWCFYSICDKYLKGYFSPGMEMIQIDGEILFSLLKKVNPKVHRLLTKQGLDPIMYMTEWFLCAFTRSLPHETLLRVWDIFMCEGVKVLFKMALLVIKFSLPSSSYSRLKKQFPSMYETLQALRSSSLQVPELKDEDFVIQQILKINITVEDFQYEHQRQIAKRNKLKRAEAAKVAAAQSAESNNATNATSSSKR